MRRRPDDLWYLSRQDYLDGERAALTKSEWVDGVAYARAGASKRHVGVVSQLVAFLAEALSPSTNRVDKIEKRDAYLALPTLETYWIIDPESKVVEAWERTADGWTGLHHTAAEPMTVACLGVTVRVVDIVGP